MRRATIQELEAAMADIDEHSDALQNNTYVIICDLLRDAHRGASHIPDRTQAFRRVQEVGYFNESIGTNWSEIFNIRDRIIADLEGMDSEHAYEHENMPHFEIPDFEHENMPHFEIPDLDPYE